LSLSLSLCVCVCVFLSPPSLPMLARNSLAASDETVSSLTSSPSQMEETQSVPRIETGQSVLEKVERIKELLGPLWGPL
ncbi:hypothetical protein ASPZODRAFT_134414, partial [Penicilliopsis zonata CBS 506.65]